MKERPILFSGPMVRALLDGSKTQTRRVVKQKVAETLEWFGGKSDDDDDRELAELLGQRTEEKGLRVWCHEYPEEGSVLIRCPYGQPGDRLWVRESFAHMYRGNAQPGKRAPEDVAYMADNLTPDPCVYGSWKPSIHMPRWASRITLEITRVRVERLQDISEADALAEGIVRQPDGGHGLADTTHYHHTDPRQSYFSLWEAINGDGSVAANPWVWAVTFQKQP